jgi:hypothetical protein
MAEETNPEVRFDWRRGLLAVLLGNAIYFSLAAIWLPNHLEHQPFQLDWGLALDFAICAGVYLVLLQTWRN